MPTKKPSAAHHAAALLPLAIGLGMHAAAPRQSASLRASEPAVCSEFNIDGTDSTALKPVTLPPGQTCATRKASVGDFLLPDPACTPGAINPTITQEVLQNPDFTTKCVRDQATTAAQKATTYQFYGQPHPSNNTGKNQTCELDHLISLELGGADTLDNIWPQCGPDGVQLSERFFKRKDAVENFLAAQVRAGKMSLSDAQQGISTDWTQYLDAAEGCGDSQPCE
jgi:hypothetical protein